MAQHIQLYFLHYNGRSVGRLLELTTLIKYNESLIKFIVYKFTYVRSSYITRKHSPVSSI